LLEWPKEASAQPDSSSEVTSVVTEKPGNPLDSQAWAPKDSVLISLENLHAFELRHVGPWLTFPSQAQGVYPLAYRLAPTVHTRGGQFRFQAAFPFSFLSN